MYPAYGREKDRRNFVESYRGMFRNIRNILDRLTYDDKNPNIDKYLSDRNVGGQKGRSVRHNIFILNAILNSIRRGAKEAHDMQVYNVAVMKFIMFSNASMHCGWQNASMQCLKQDSKITN